MQGELEDVLAQYAYEVPKELIAGKGAEPRESARLMIYDRAQKSVHLSQVKNLIDFLPKNTLLVFNETKVIPARFHAYSHEKDLDITVTTISDGEIQTLSSKRLTQGAAAEAHGHTFVVSKRDDKFTYYATNFSAHEMTAFLFAHGVAPLPPYIKHTPLSESEAKARYQTVFAKNEGSVAAPTASLHFSESLMHALREKGIDMAFVTLHVGLGTFLPVTQEHLSSGKLHEEEYSIEPVMIEKISQAKKMGKTIIPVGTTSLRTLESAFDEKGECISPSGATTLFIRPGYRFKMAGGLMTNFHVPESSLLMLVDAFLGGEDTWRELYSRAIAEKFRLFSFGDGMLIL